MGLFTRGQLEGWAGDLQILGDFPGEISSVEIDSRRVGEGSLFVALPGENTDGHEYVFKALDMGAAAVVVSREWAEQRNLEQERGCWIIADSPLRILQEIAEGYLALFPRLVKIAVTGSNGKTTTKELAGSVLSHAGNALYTQGNFNSDIGLPLTVFRVREKHRWALFEMGMNRKGEISELVRIVKPDLALITNVGTAHIGMLGSAEALASEKKSIFSGFKGNQTALVYEEDSWRDFLLQGVQGQGKTFGPRSCKGFLGVEPMGVQGQKLLFEQGEVLLRFLGRHHVLNCLAAKALADELGIGWEDFKAGIEACEPPFGRSEVLEGPITLIRDCYNANPDSMAAALDSLDQMEHRGRKVAVLGDMGELGHESARGHLEVCRKARGLDFSMVFTLGPKMKEAAGLEKAGFRCFTDYLMLEKALEDFLKPGDLVLIKGSRTLKLEKLTEPLMNL